MIALAVFLAPFVTYACKLSTAYLNFAYTGIALFFGVGVCCVANVAARARALQWLKSARAFYAVLFVTLALLLFLQACVVKGGWFKTGWDIGVLTDFNNQDSHASYYSMYPNQLFLAGLFEKIAALGNRLGFMNGYLCVVVGGCVCVTASLGMICCVARKLAGYKVGYLTILFGTIYIGLSPWFLVPYSDTYAMLWTTLALFAFVCIKKTPVRAGVIVFATIIGYMIKPTVVFIGLAVAVVVCLRSISSGAWRTPLLGRSNIAIFLHKAVPVLLAILVATGGAIGVSTVVKEKVAGLDENKSMGLAHYLMMGFSTDTLGFYNGNDLEYSASFSTVNERNAADFNEFLRRVKEMGPVGVVKQLVKKSLTNYADGTFFWAGEGAGGIFFDNTYGDSSLVKTVYGIDDAQNRESSVVREALFRPAAQVLWFFVLIGIVLLLKERNVAPEISVMLLALLMLSVFLVMFEARARYLFLYLPYFVCLGIIGFTRACNRFTLRACGREQIDSNVELPVETMTVRDTSVSGASASSAPMAKRATYRKSASHMRRNS
jgi:hypothetical protein